MASGGGFWGVGSSSGALDLIICLTFSIEGLTLCKTYLLEDSSRDLEDVGNQYLWFRSIVKSYKRLKGIDLSIDEFTRVSLAFFAQELLGKPLGESLSKLVQEINREVGGDDNE